MSVGIGAGVWAATSSPGAVAPSVATGVFVDVDHVIDFYNLYIRKDRRRLLLLGHGWEYTALGFAVYLSIWGHPWMLAAVLGHLGHLISDQIRNRPEHPLGYFITYRASRGFRRQRVFSSIEPTLSKALSASIPFWDRFESVLPQALQRVLRDE